MSIFRTAEIPCPSCGAEVSFELVHSVNSDRRPDLRDDILNRAFQRQPCPGCGFEFRVEPEFSYMDMGRGQFLAAWPSDKVTECAAYEARTMKTFEHAYGKDAPPEARDIGRLLTPRAVFGWLSLNEKILAGQAGVDDVSLELAKLLLIRTERDAAFSPDEELRLVGSDDDQLMLGWFSRGGEEPLRFLSVPRSVIREIEEAPEKWAALRKELSSGLFVDYRKLFMAAV